MHCLSAAVLLLSFSLSLIGPAVFSDSENQLPTCCRSHGKHGCSMKRASERSSELSVIKAAGKCPLFRIGGVVLVNGKTLLPTGARAVTTALVAHPTGPAQTEAGYRISFTRAWQKRGPPLLTT